MNGKYSGQGMPETSLELIERFRLPPQEAVIFLGEVKPEEFKMTARMYGYIRHDLGIKITLKGAYDCFNNLRRHQTQPDYKLTTLEMSVLEQIKKLNASAQESTTTRQTGLTGYEKMDDHPEIGIEMVLSEIATIIGTDKTREKGPISRSLAESRGMLPSRAVEAYANAGFQIKRRP